MASDFHKKYNSLFCLACTLIIKAISHNYKIHPQIFVLMYSVAMETSTIIVKMLFFSIFHTLLPFSELCINVEMPHYTSSSKNDRNMKKIMISSDLMGLPWQHGIYDINFKQVFFF